MSDDIKLTSTQELDYSDLKKSYFLLFLTNISIFHSNVILIGLMTSAFIVLIIILIGLIEVYRPLKRVNLFAK